MWIVVLFDKVFWNIFQSLIVKYIFVSIFLPHCEDWIPFIVRPLRMPPVPTACCCCWVASVVSDSVQPHRQQPTRLPRPWDSPGKNTGSGCHFLLHPYCLIASKEAFVAWVTSSMMTPMVHIFLCFTQFDSASFSNLVVFLSVEEYLLL